MTLLFMDSFDHYNTTTLLLKKYDAHGTWGSPGIAWHTDYGRHSSMGIRVTAGDTRYSYYFSKSNFPNSQILIAGCARYFSNTLTFDTVGYVNSFVFLDDTTAQVTMSVQTDGSLAVHLGNRTGSIIAQSDTGVINLHSWHYIEFKAKIDNAVGYAVVMVNGVEVINETGLDTQVSANAYANAVFTSMQPGNSSSGVYVDDLYVCNGQGSDNNDLLGDVRVDALFADGAGASTDFTPSAGSNYDCVNETVPNDDTDYVSETTASDHDTYTFDNLATASGTVYGVQQLLYARKDDAGSRSIKTVARSGTTDYPNSNAYSIGDSYTYYSDILEQDPDTSSAWIISGINAAEFGVELEA